MKGNNIKKYSFRGKKVAGVKVSCKAMSDPWHRYKLGDGTVLDICFIVEKMVRLEGQYDTEGKPIYQMHWGLHLRLKYRNT
jgi:hypothetical protein